MKRRLIALVLVVSLVASMCTTAFAGYYQGVEEGEKSGVKYVSLGDSMTNGYGLEGYDANAGVEDYGDAAYPNTFAEHLGAEHAQLAMSGIRTEDIHWLLELDYNDQETINLIADFIEENDKDDEDEVWNQELWNNAFGCGDYWTVNEIANHGRTDAAYKEIKTKLERDGKWDEYENLPGEGRANKTAVIAKYFQDSVAAADVISLSVGNGNIGVFGFGRILETIGFADSKTYENYDVNDLLRECDGSMLGYAQTMVDEMYAAVDTEKGENPLIDVVVYIGVSLALNYAGTVDAVLQMNPDVEIVLVSVMNTFANEDKSNFEGSVSIGDLMGIVVEPINAFIAALPTCMQIANNDVYADATFYYAEADEVECWVETYGEAIEKGEGVIRPRFVESIVGYCDCDDECDDASVCPEFSTGMIWGMIKPMFNSLLAEKLAGKGFDLELTNIDLADVKTYEAGEYDKLTADKLFSCAIYLAFEQAICESANKAVSLESIMGLGSLSENGNSLFGGVAGALTGGLDFDAIIETVAENVEAAGIAEVVSFVNEKQTEFITFCNTNNMDYTATESAIVYYCFANGIENADTLTALFAAKYAAKYAAIELGGNIKPLLADALVKEANISGLLALFGRCMLGNGLGGHPSAAGHYALAEAVIEAYDGEHTAADETKENLIIAAEALAALVAEYYDEAYAYAYAYAAENGYITEATDAIDDVIDALKAVDLSGIEMTEAFRKDAEELRSEIIDTLEEAKALILEADVLDQDSMDALLTLLGEAAEDVQALTDLLVQAGVDVNELVIVPALNAAYDKLVNEVIPAAEAAAEEIAAKAYEYLVALAEQAGEDLAEAYDAFVEAFLEFLPEADAWLYDWFYNNPDKVIAFFEENGEFFVENAEAAATVLGYIAYTFGPDVLEWVMENPEEALEQFVSWYEKYGERTWAMILVYLEELGVIDAAEDLYGCIEDALADLYEQLEDCTDEAYAEIMEQIEVLRAQLDALRAEIEAAASELNAAIYEQLMKGLEEIDALLNELEAIVKGEIEASVEELKALIAELDAAIEDLLKTIANDVEGTVQAAIQAAVEAIKEQLSYIDGAAEWLEEAVAEAYEAFIDALLEALPYIDEALYDFFYNNPDKVIAFFEENGEFFAENAEAVLAVLGYIAAEFGDEALEYVLNNPEEALEQFVSWYEKYGERTWAMILVYLNELGLLDCIPTEEEIKAAIEAIQAEIEKAYEALNNAAEDAVAELEAIIAELEAAVEELKAMVEDYAQMLDEAVRAEVEKAIAKLEAAIAELEAAIEELKAAVEAQVEAAKKAVEEALAKLEAVIAEVEAAINGVIADVNAAIEELYEALEQLKEEAISGAAQIVEELKAALEELREVIAENADKIAAEVLAELNAAIDEIEAALAEIDAIIKGAVDGTIEDVIAELEDALAELQDAVEALIEAAEGKVDEIIEEAIAAFEAAANEAMTGEYEIAEDSYYVSIGDASASAEPETDAYSYKLATYLSENYGLDMDTQFVQLANEDLTIAELETVLQASAAEIAKADLVSVGVGNNIVNDFVAMQVKLAMAGKPTQEMDWTAFVGTEGLEYVDEALVDINAKFLESGLDAQYAAVMTLAVESYAYAYMNVAASYPEIVNAIHEINPEALVLLIGMYNPMEGVVLTYGETELNLGEYVQYFVDVANFEMLACAMLMDNTVFVSAPDVETNMTAGQYDIVQFLSTLLFFGTEDMRATNNGHEYIKDQIISAITFASEEDDFLLGDVTGDGKVNMADVTAIRRYLISEELYPLNVEKAGEVTGDGKINMADVTAIRRYLISSDLYPFPIVK